MQILKKLYCSY